MPILITCQFYRLAPTISKHKFLKNIQTQSLAPVVCAARISTRFDKWSIPGGDVPYLMQADGTLLQGKFGFIKV